MGKDRFPEGFRPRYDVEHRTEKGDRRPLSHFNDEDIARLYDQTRYGIREGVSYQQRRRDGDAPRLFGDVADQLPFARAESPDQIYKMFDAVTDEFLARQLERNMMDDSAVSDGDDGQQQDPAVDDGGMAGGEVMDVRRGMNFLLDNAVNAAYPDQTSPTVNFAAENYGFFAPYNRESNRAFAGTNYLGPADQVARNPFDSYVNQDNDFEDSSGLQDGYVNQTENEMFSAMRFLEQLKEQFGLTS